MNVLFIITDQQRADHLSCMGNPVLKTPNIDRIATNGGVRFTKYFCANPICMPNRASFFTGAYPSEHKTRSNGINLNPELPMITKVLRNEGYHTCSVGKLHFNFMAPPYSRFKKYVKSVENLVGWIQGDINSSSFPTPYYGFEEVDLTNGHGDVIGGHYFEWLKESETMILKELIKFQQDVITNKAIQECSEISLIIDTLLIDKRAKIAMKHHLTEICSLLHPNLDKLSERIHSYFHDSRVSYL